MLRFLQIALCLSTLAPGALAAPPQLPFPQHRPYAAAALSPSHRTRDQLEADVRAAYDRWKSHYLRQMGTEADGQPRYRVLLHATPQAETVSEGQGYGMMIVAFLAGHDPQAQTIFDGLWEFARDHRSDIDPHLMDWHVPASEASEADDNSAFDGDADIAFALLLADRQWGSGGRIDYRQEAETLMAAILASTIGAESRYPLLGDWVVPDGEPPYSQFTPRSSDFMPDHFRAFHRASGNPAWLEVLAAIQAATSAVQSRFAPLSGLLPDFLVPTSPSDLRLKPAPPNFLEAPTDGAYSYNAGRVPWRLGTDALVHGDLTSAAQVRKIAQWIAGAAGGDPHAIQPGYELSGAPVAGDSFFSTFFAAPFGVAAMLEPGQQAWLNAVYDAVRGETQGYYEDSVTLLCLLVMAGNWWDPTRVSDGTACIAAPDRLCLGGERFEVTVAWATPQGARGAGQAVRLTADTGTFWFFREANVELFVKLLDGCPVNGHKWFFAAGLTSVAVELRVTDHASGATRTYSNPQGRPFAPIQDTSAFTTCP